ncbi:MAG: hypothetical protein COA43_00610 [Robiginitomaculum sp.]|nr:MAG: hypothetical protein COA43_00610 [Robiginitomaculum sp.]
MRIRCKTCKSEDVRRDAFVAFDKDTQQWVLAEMFEQGSCNACEDRTILEEIPDEMFAYVTVVEHKNGLEVKLHRTVAAREAYLRGLIEDEWDAGAYGPIADDNEQAYAVLKENDHDLHIHYLNVPKNLGAE